MPFAEVPSCVTHRLETARERRCIERQPVVLRLSPVRRTRVEERGDPDALRVPSREQRRAGSDTEDPLGQPFGLVEFPT